MTVPYGWAKRPMLERMDQLQQGIPITIIYGSRSSVDSNSGSTIKSFRPDSHVEIIVSASSGYFKSKVFISLLWYFVKLEDLESFA